jgi:membrane fusion protein (multidrug efflux system)
MDAIIEDSDHAGFANGKISRDLHADTDIHRHEFDPPVIEPSPLHPDDALEAYRRSPEQPPPVEYRPEPRNDDAAGDSGGRGWKPLRLVALAVALAIAAAVAPFAWNYLQSYESTDDAQIDGHIDPLSSRIDGTIVAVHVEDDDRVKAGELIAEIDPRDYQVAVEQASARLDYAQAEVISAQQDYAAALARVREDDAANFEAQRDARRYATLLDKAVVSQEENDHYSAAARVDAAKVDSDREAAGSAFRLIAARQADVAAAQADLDQARLNLSYTKIYAPADGVVGKREVQLGSRVQPGETLMFVTETGNIWVTADFKETQLARMHPGQRVTIHIDTFGRDYRGYVENMPGASGDRFSLLPPENATGNYVKVVQRLSVRIRFEPGQDPNHLLHPGMSVEPTVWLR